MNYTGWLPKLFPHDCAEIDRALFRRKLVRGMNGINIQDGLIWHEKDSFIGKIVTTGPSSESDYSDERYWIKEQYCSNTGTVSTDAVSFADRSTPLHVTATNIAELVSSTHSLSAGDYVKAYRVKDIQNPQVTRWVFERNIIRVIPNYLCNLWCFNKDCEFINAWMIGAAGTRLRPSCQDSFLNYIFVYDGGYLRRLSFSAGEPVVDWTTGLSNIGTDLIADGISSVYVLNGRFTYAASDSQCVSKVNMSDGSVAWAQPTFGVNESVQNSTGIAFSGSSPLISGYMYSDDTSGEAQTILKLNTDGTVAAWYLLANFNYSEVYARMRYDGTYIYQIASPYFPGDEESSYPYVWKHRLSTGAETWATAITSSNSHLFDIKLFDSNTKLVVCGLRNSNKTVWCLNASDGSIAWSYDTGGKATSLAIDSSDNIYILHQKPSGGHKIITKLNSAGALQSSYDWNRSGETVPFSDDGQYYEDGFGWSSPQINVLYYSPTGEAVDLDEYLFMTTYPTNPTPNI
jgi:hypothetical protein